jgi:hypothetical protein
MAPDHAHLRLVDLSSQTPSGGDLCATPNRSTTPAKQMTREWKGRFDKPRLGNADSLRQGHAVRAIGDQRHCSKNSQFDPHRRAARLTRGHGVGGLCVSRRSTPATARRSLFTCAAMAFEAGPLGSPRQSKIASTCNFPFQNDTLIVLRCRRLGSSSTVRQRINDHCPRRTAGEGFGATNCRPGVRATFDRRRDRLVFVGAGCSATGRFRGFATGFVHGITKGDSQLEIPPTSSHLLVTVGAFGLSIVLLYAVSIRGRIVGGW